MISIKHTYKKENNRFIIDLENNKNIIYNGFGLKNIFIKKRVGNIVLKIKTAPLD